MWPFRQFVVLSVALVISFLCFFLSGCSSPHAKPIAPKHTPSTSSAVPVAITQPPTAKDVATTLHCKRFRDKGASPLGGVVTSGICHMGGVKYGIDTFASKDARDNWLKMAERLGVTPMWETDTAVIYTSIMK